MTLQINTTTKEIHLLDMVPLDTLIQELEVLIPSFREYKLTTYYPYQSNLQPYYPPYIDTPTTWPNNAPYYYNDHFRVTCEPDAGKGTYQNPTTFML